jgi:integrase
MGSENFARRLWDVSTRQVHLRCDTPRAKGLATTTIRGIVRTLSACLSGAMDENRIELNPAQSLRKYLRARDTEVHEPDPLSAEDTARLLTTVRAQFSRWQAFVLCGLRTGLRLSELIGLDWPDLDERAATLTVQRAVVRGVIGTPKNHQRRVPEGLPSRLTCLRLEEGQAGADDHVSGGRRR